ncbi:ubiquinone biosynthesis protein [Desulfohalotomaculum tongense]|uniref:2-polyprenylphenol 6-hydroxylase n=1 Tax=Desulforadius tongensis TaxID=1216062 RepID=UPI00195E6CA0|nr:2-polyprenylphenol 6-hydroxylase [Desulforadius tongensis]MBM7853967.1 ubiquinone biosynthesis protein [Desulforadius tongensis]
MQMYRRYKHLKRYREIINILLKHGFGHILHQLGLAEFLSIRKKILFKKESKIEELSMAQRVRLAVEELGPTFIKAGQILSTRPDLLPPDYIGELKKLQDKVPAFEFDAAKQQIERELDQPLTELFTKFNPEPLASASIGQVYRAMLPGGQEVVVKVQRPDIEKIINIDLEIMYDIARFLESRLNWSEMYSLVEIVAEFDRTLHEELDYNTEGRNADTFRKNFNDNPEVLIPAVYWEYSSRRVLTMEYVEGVKLNNLQEINRLNLDRSILARKLAQTIFKQVLIDGFFHADPHPGNLAVLPNGKIIFMDFGMVGFLTEESKNSIGNLMLALVSKDADAVMKAVLNMGVIAKNVDKKLLRRDIDLLQRKYYEVPLSQISLGEALNDIMGIAFKYHIRMPTEFAMLVKTLLTLEGLVKELDPKLSIVKIVEPFAKRLLIERLSPQTLSKTILKNLQGFGDILSFLPEQLGEVLDLAAKGELKLKHQFPQINEVLNTLNIMTNRIAFSTIITGLVIGSAFLTQKENILFGQIPIAEAGFLVAGIMSFWFLVSILRSGGF